MAQDTTTAEESATDALPSESPAEEIIMEEANKRQVGDEGTAVSPAAVETKADDKENVENPATLQGKKVESKRNNDESSGTAAADATSRASISKKGTIEGGSKENDGQAGEEKGENADALAGPVVSATKRTRPPFKYNPEKVTLRFLFANRDGLTVTVECKPGDTVGEVKGQLLSVWPKDLPDCCSDDVRLICMGKGILMPDSRTLEDCQVPVFKTHPTPINVSVRPKFTVVEATKSGVKEKTSNAAGASSAGGVPGRTTEQTSQGCGCVIQ